MQKSQLTRTGVAAMMLIMTCVSGGSDGIASGPKRS